MIEQIPIADCTLTDIADGTTIEHVDGIIEVERREIHPDILSRLVDWYGVFNADRPIPMGKYTLTTPGGYTGTVIVTSPGGRFQGSGDFKFLADPLDSG